VHSYIQKGLRAEKHLNDLRVAIEKWSATKPFEVRTTGKGANLRHDLHFTSSPPPTIEMIAADFVYNIHSGLGHMMAALVPPKRRYSVYFPIYFQGVWDEPVPGEPAIRRKQRARWRSDTQFVAPEAIEILKSVQPDEHASRDRDPEISSLLLIHRIANRDKHTRLPVIVNAVRDETATFTTPSGERVTVPRDPTAPAAQVSGDGSNLHLPPGVTDVVLSGTPLVAIRIPSPKAEVEMLPSFERTLAVYNERVVHALLPYVYVR